MTDDVVTRVTVNLGPRAVEALNAMVELTEDTKTQVINKALQLYAAAQTAQAAGGGAWIRDNGRSDLVQTRFH